MLQRTTSIISDGSEASEMIRNNSKESYSERAVAKFKSRMRKYINAALIILAIVLLYFLFMPSAKFSKAPRGSKSKMNKIKDNWL